MAFPYEQGYLEAQRWQRVGATDEEIDGLLAEYTDDWVGSVSDDDLENVLAGRRDPAEPPFDVAGSTIPEVLAHAGDDAQVAADVLAQEQAAPKPRTTLVSALQAIVDAAPSEEPVDPQAGAEGAIHAPPITDDNSAGDDGGTAPDDTADGTPASDGDAPAPDGG